MKVLFVATAYPRFPGDVITPWLVELIMRLRKRGIDVSVFTSSYQGLGDQVLEGIKVYRFRYFLKAHERLTHEETAVDRVGRGPFNLILTLCYLFFGAYAIKRLTKKEKFDIIHIHWPFPHILFGILGKRFGCAGLVSSFYGVEIRWLKKKFPFLVRPFGILLNQSDIITAISTHTAKELTGITNKKISIIPFSAAIREKSGAVTDEKEIIFVGRLVERKGVQYLIKAYREIKNEIPHRLIIIGDGPERGQLENLAASLNLRDRIIFTGKISDGALTRHYQRASFLVLPAIYDKKGDTEGLGVVLLESMSYAKPVIASNVGGITDIVVDGVNGYLVPPADEAKLAAAMKIMATNEPLKDELGRQAKRSVDEKFNWDKITKELIELYETHN